MSKNGEVFRLSWPRDKLIILRMKQRTVAYSIGPIKSLKQTVACTIKISTK
jgi:hypothetical protein